MAAILKKGPVSIDTLLAAQREAEKAQSRPKFLTKVQREALAAEKEKEDAAVRMDREREAAKNREVLERAAGRERYGGGGGGYTSVNGFHNHNDRQQQPQRYGNNNGYGNANGNGYTNANGNGHSNGNGRGPPLNYGTAPTAPRAMRGGETGKGNSGEDRNRERRSNGVESRNSQHQGHLREGHQGNQTHQGQSHPGTAAFNPSYPEYALEDSSIPIFDPAALKARYLGDSGSRKRKTRKQSDKKFVFDWDKAEDTVTADEVDPFYRALRAGGAGDARVFPGPGAGPAYRNRTMANYRQDTIGPGTVATKKEEEEDDEPIAGPKTMTKAKAKGALDERHWSEKKLEDMRERDWRIFREDFSIAARGGQIPLPLRTWQEASIPQSLQDIVSDIGYSEPSAIQRQAIPIGLNVRDMIGIAETGSGKTAAFVIPMLAYIMKLPPLTDSNRHMGPYALIMAPTRELAQQIEVETRKFTSQLGYKCVSIVGGRSMEEQALNMRDGAEIIIATPGRLKDCIERSVVVFSQCTYVVMDEADRMISLGFEEVINFILDSLPVSNMKPDSEEAEDASKMLQTLIGGEDGAPLSDVYLYRQTVSNESVLAI